MLQIKIFYCENDANNWLKYNPDLGILKEDIRISSVTDGHCVQPMIGVVYNE